MTGKGRGGHRAGHAPDGSQLSLPVAEAPTPETARATSVAAPSAAAERRAERGEARGEERATARAVAPPPAPDGTASAPVAARAPALAPVSALGPVRFVKYYEKASTLLAADQMSAALAAHGLDARSLPVSELARARNGLLIFVKTSRLDHLLLARLRGNRLLLDVHDTVVFKGRLKNAWLYDGAIFKNRRQQQDFDRPGWRSRVLYHQWDPRYRPHEVPAGEFRAAYLGDRRSLTLFGELDGLTYIECDWFRHAPHFNCHLSVREPGRDFLYKPNAKIATAAACRAVLVTTRDVSARELLGDDYPFFCEPERASVVATLERARRAAAGGAEWRQALARLDEVRARLAIDRVAEDYLAYFADLARARAEGRGTVPGTAPGTGPRTAGPPPAAGARRPNG